MKWRHIPKKPIPETEWHLKFAWTPVLIGDYKHWLSFVYRRKVENSWEYIKSIWY